MNEEQRAIIVEELARYVQEDEPMHIYRELARQHRLLPILPGWTGFVGLREDGQTFFVSDEDGSVSTEVNEHELHLSLIRGAKLFPRLQFLKPVIADDWIECRSCEGTGQLLFRDADGPTELACICGGLGKLPPALARYLRKGRS